jgi:epoxide hydrolase-like predicted phosphatase
MRRTAVIFDLGGVVLESPLQVLSAYTDRHGIPPDAVPRVFLSGGENGPWQRFERGELTKDAFIAAFDRAADDAGTPFSTAKLMVALETGLTVRPRVLGTIRTLRARGFQVAALTNNWNCGPKMGARLDALKPEFDVFVESWRVGMRKPEVGIYQRVLAGLGVAAEAVVFLDDFGQNLGPARDLGMTTIRVDDIGAALLELDGLLPDRGCNNSPVANE